MASYFVVFTVMSMITLVRAHGPGEFCMKVPPDVEDCYRSFYNKPISDSAAKVACFQKLFWNFKFDLNMTAEDHAYFRRISGLGIKSGKIMMPPTGYRLRREYRTLSDKERNKFHRALNILYMEGTMARFARLVLAAVPHFNGPSFLPWCRVLLVMFEEALRQVDGDVFLPYWDSTVDDAMDNPVNSYLWTPKYFGTGTGDVVSGFAAGWVTHQGNLQRQYGEQGRLFSKAQIRDVLSQCRLQDISKPTAEPRFDFEFMHFGAHVWLGGDDAFLPTVGYDPVAYMHHAYMDYIWELFRMRQASTCGVNPTNDYPDVAPGNPHHPDAPMVGFDWLANRYGIQAFWTQSWYSYETTPTCPNCCPTCMSPSPMLCDIRLNVCVARSRRNYPKPGDVMSPMPSRDAGCCRTDCSNESSSRKEPRCHTSASSK